MSDDLQQQAAALLAAVEAPEGEQDDGESKYTRLTPDERALILALHAREVSQREIARIVGCHESNVSRTVKFVDTRVGARLMLEQGAAKLADKVLRTKSSETARKTLTQVGVLPKDGEGGGVQVNVMLGMQATAEQMRGFLPDITAGVVVASPPDSDAAA